MDPTFLANLALFVLLLGNSFDLFSGSDSASDNSTEDHPLYVPADYAQEIEGSAGNDNLHASEGDDGLAWLLGDGDDSLTGSAGDDYADGGAGNDTLFMEDGDDRVAAGAGDDQVHLGAGNDSLLGGDGDDHLFGDDGDDAIAGEAGNDTLIGGLGSDRLLGGDGDDVLAGHAADRSGAEGATAIDGTDTLSGGAGNDTLLLGQGDRGEGGAGDDLFQIDRRGTDLDHIAQVDDFADGDRLQLIYTPHFGSDGQEIPPEIHVSATEDGTAGLIRLGDVTVAAVIGGQNLTADDIELIPDAG